MRGDEMHVKRTASIVLGAGAIAAWLAGAATSNRAVPDPIVPPPAQIDARGSDLANEIAKLRERLRPAASPRTPGRNLFAFRATAPAAEPVAPAHAAAVADSAPARPAETSPVLKLSGLAEDPGPDATVVRIAFITTGGQLFMVKEGEPVGDRYRVERITPDAVELTDLLDNSTRRLVLK
jgi:hypothetical protein